MTRRNGLIAKFEADEFAVGAMFSSGDYAAARAVGDSSADFAIVDMEHQGFDFPALGHTLQWMMGRAGANALPVPATPIVRIPANASEHNQWMPKQTLDYGAFGLVLPQVTRAADAAATVTAMRYPQGPDRPGPVGERGVSPAEAIRYWGATRQEYFTTADVWPLNPDGDLLLIALVEHVDAWQRIEEIVAVPGLGAVLWGPGDGSVSMGFHDFASAQESLVPHRRRVVEACHAAGIRVGTPVIGDPAHAVDQGFDFAFLTRWDESAAARLREHAAAR